MNPIPKSLPADLAPCWHADPATLVPFAGGRPESDGILFRFMCAGEPAVLKIIEVNVKAPHALRVSAERANLMAHLGTHGVSMPRLLPASDGAASVVMQSEGRTFRAYAMELVSGKLFHQVPAAEHGAFIEGMGAVIGQMHAATVSYPVWDGLPVPGEAHAPLTWQNEMDFFCGWMRDDAARACWERLRVRLAELPMTRGTMGFIHNDPHPWNFLWQDGTLTVLDFDVASCHFLVNDLAIALYSLLMEQTNRFARPLDPAAARGALRTLMRGYNRFHALPDGWEAQLDLFLQYRRLLLLCAMSDGLGSVPPFLAAMYGHALAETPIWPG